ADEQHAGRPRDRVSRGVRCRAPPSSAAAPPVGRAGAEPPSGTGGAGQPVPVRRARAGHPGDDGRGHGADVRGARPHHRL
ncbi:MAG: hypothetical protein AVDCRST_MAG17-591, partial [uncultured Solirubrobacterales bacterium]